VADVKYHVAFERIGRRRDIPPQTFEAANADELAESVWHFARRYLASHDAFVSCNLETGHGSIESGRFGKFTIKAAS
jgi:hypothetical protein